MIKAVIFDKDGTLIDFDIFWVSVSENAIRLLFDKIGCNNVPMSEMLASIGVINGVSDIDGLLCKGTYEQIALAFNAVLGKYGYAMPADEVCAAVLDAYNKSADIGVVKPTCDNISGVLKSLKGKGIKLAVVTVDNYEITEKCLKKLGILELFDKVYTDDGKTPTKPDPYCVFDFADAMGIEKDTVLMVGDTMTDVRFARNAGIRVLAVGAKAENRERLKAYADEVKPDISCVEDFISKE